MLAGAELFPFISFLKNSNTAIRLIMQPCFAVCQNCGIDNITANRSARRWANGLFELRHIGKLNTRIIWFFMKQRRIIRYSQQRPGHPDA